MQPRGSTPFLPPANADYASTVKQLNQRFPKSGVPSVDPTYRFAFVLLRILNEIRPAHDVLNALVMQEPRDTLMRSAYMRPLAGATEEGQSLIAAAKFNQLRDSLDIIGDVNGSNYLLKSVFDTQHILNRYIKNSFQRPKFQGLKEEFEDGRWTPTQYITQYNELHEAAGTGRSFLLDLQDSVNQHVLYGSPYEVAAELLPAPTIQQAANAVTRRWTVASFLSGVRGMLPRNRHKTNSLS